MINTELFSAPDPLVHSLLTQQYRLASPIGDSAAIAPVFDQQGLLHIYTIGTDKRVYEILQDPTSDTGWSVFDMNFNDNIRSYTPMQIAAGRDSDGAVYVFVLDAVNTGYVISDKRHSQWTVFTSIDPTREVEIRLCNDSFGKLHFTAAQIFHGSAAFFAYDFSKLDQGHFIAKSPEAVNNLKDYRIGSDASHRLSIFISGQCYSSAQNIWFSGKKVLGENGAEYFWPQTSFSKLALAPDSVNPGDSFVFAIQSDYLYWCDQGLQLSNVKVSEIRADLDPKGRLSVLALGADQRLYHTRQDDPASDLLRWTDMVRLNDELTFRDLSTVRDHDGNIVALARLQSKKDALYKITQDPDTSDWRFDEIETGAGPLETVSAYASRITVLDSSGLPAPNADVEIWASSPTRATINGEIFYLDPETATSCKANYAALLAVVIPTDNLHAPTLTIRTDSMPAHGGLAIEPNAGIQAQLRELTGDQLLNARTADGAPIKLLSGKYAIAAVAHSVAQAVNQAMAIAGAKGATARPNKGVPGAGRPCAGAYRVSRREGAAPAHIALADAPDSHWELDFSSGSPVFTQLSSADALALMSKRRAEHPEAKSLFGFDVDWGDIWNSFTTKVSDIVSMVVSATVDAVNKVVTEIKAQITLLLDGVEAVFEATVRLVEQVFDMVSGIFKKVADDFEDFLKWLGYVFDTSGSNLTLGAHV
jgi:hypothetical protein